MYRISSLHVQDTMVWPSLLPQDVYSVCAQSSEKIPTAHSISAGIVATKITPSLFVNLDYKFFFMFAAINIGGIAVFSM